MDDKTSDDDTYLSYDEEKKRRLCSLIEAERLSGANTVEELEAELFRFISARYASAEPAAVRLVELNRRFGVTASRLGTVTRDIVLSLINKGLLDGDRFRDAMVLWPKEAHDKAMAPYLLKLDLLPVIEKAIKGRAWPETNKERTVDKSSTKKKKPLGMR